MAFLQLKTKDQKYYELVKNGELEILRDLIGNPAWFKKIGNLIAFPSNQQLKENLYNERVAFISSKEINELFVVKNLKNTSDGGVLTKQQYLYDEDINGELYNKFGMMVSNPSVSFKDLGGFTEPKQDMLRTQEYIKQGLVQKNLSMFLGVSRSGKSYFAECLAGELGYKLIILDLGVMMCSKNPSKQLDDFFYYLESIDKYVLLIDEIEKVADPEAGGMSKVLIGKLLTIFNNFNSESGFNIGANFVIATANNISILLDKNPEFINRFGLKYFVNYPEQSSFIDVCNYYLSKMKITGITGEDIYYHSSAIYSKDEIPRMSYEEVKKFGKYASGEIKEFMAVLLLFSEQNSSGLRVNEEILSKVLNLQKPQIQFANTGVLRTIEAAKIANFREVD